MSYYAQAVPSKKQLPGLNNLNAKIQLEKLQVLIKSSQEKLNTLLNQYAPLEGSDPIHWDFMQQIETIEDEISKTWAPIGHLTGVSETPELRSAYYEGIEAYTHWSTALGQNVKFYQLIESLANHPDFASLKVPQQTIVKNKQRIFKHSGIHIKKTEQERYQTLQSELAQLTTKFESNIKDSSIAQSILIQDKEQLKGLSEKILKVAAQAAQNRHQEGWLFALNGYNYQAVLTTADDRQLRKQFYKAWVTRASDQSEENVSKSHAFDNSKLVFNILSKRHQLSQLIPPIKNYAERSLALNKMLDNPQTVLEFLNQLMQPARESASKELAKLQAFGQAHYPLDSLEIWDLPYLSEKLKQEEFGLQEEALRQYFPLPRVLNGLFTLIKAIFKVDVKPIEDIELYHPDVQAIELYDEKQYLRGYIYLDLYSRPNKREGAWVDECQRRRRRSDHILQLPIVFLICNFSPKVNDDPVLLTHSEVVTLFHEMGHALHDVLTTVDYSEIAGTAGVAWDGVELPSQLLENFAWETEVLSLISSHAETHESLPSQIVQALQKSKRFNSGLHLLRQLEFSLFDFRVHLEFDPDQGLEQVQTLLDQIREKTQLLSVPRFNRFQNSFAHIFAGAYAAGYYSYLWAEVLADDAFSRFLEEGILNPQTGHDFMTTVLEPGGSINMLELFEKFRGRKVNIQAFLNQH